MNRMEYIKLQMLKDIMPKEEAEGNRKFSRKLDPSYLQSQVEYKGGNYAQ